MTSTRKPHNNIPGYVCELKNRRTGVGHVVIYDRNKGFDCDADYRYVISCETHSTMTSAPSMPRAREIMKAVDFCEECMNGEINTPPMEFEHLPDSLKKEVLSFFTKSNFPKLDPDPCHWLYEINMQGKIARRIELLTDHAYERDTRDANYWRTDQTQLMVELMEHDRNCHCPRCDGESADWDEEGYQRHIANEGSNTWNANPDGCYYCGSDQHHSQDCREKA